MGAVWRSKGARSKAEKCREVWCTGCGLVLANGVSSWCSVPFRPREVVDSKSGESGWIPGPVFLQKHHDAEWSHRAHMGVTRERASAIRPPGSAPCLPRLLRFVFRHSVHSHSHTLTLSHSHSLTLSRSHTLTLSRSHTLSPYDPLTLSPSDPLILSPSDPLILSPSDPLTLTTLSPSHALTPSLLRAHSQESPKSSLYPSTFRQEALRTLVLP